MNYEDAENEFLHALNGIMYEEDLEEVKEDEEDEFDEDAFKSSDPTHLDNFSAELIRQELEIELEVITHHLTHLHTGQKELEQTVALLELSMEKLTAFRHSVNDYEWRNERYDTPESHLKYSLNRMAGALKERQQVATENSIDFAKRGLEALLNGTMDVSGDYSECWYGYSHPVTYGANDLSTTVRNTMKERGILSSDWYSSLTPIEKFGAEGRKGRILVENALKEILPDFIKNHE